MRRRLILALLVLSLPSLSEAQRRVRPPLAVPPPTKPAEKPPLMPGIHDSRAYSNYMLGRFSLEQYPMLSYFQTTGFVAEGIPANYWTIGDGTQLGFRAAPSLFVSADFTSSVIGGPFSMGSVDFGVRVKPWTALRVTPFFDARVSHAYTAGGGSGSAAVPFVFMYQSMYGDITTGRGNGTALGVGAETRINARLWITGAVSNTRYAMTARDMSFNSWRYDLNATRLTVGVRYHHGRWLDAP